MDRYEGVVELVKRSLSLGAFVPVEFQQIDGPESAVVVIAYVGEGESQYIQQSLCERGGAGNYRLVDSGDAPGWLHIAGERGVETAVYAVEPGTKSVRFGDGSIAGSVFESDRRSVFVDAMWRDKYEDKSLTRLPAEVLVEGEWHKVALPGVCMRLSYFVDTYLTYELDRSDNLAWAWMALNESVRTHPYEAWDVLQSAIECAASERLVASIAAGPLEDLLNFHRSTLGKTVEEAAVQSQKIKDAVALVW